MGNIFDGIQRPLKVNGSLVPRLPCVRGALHCTHRGEPGNEAKVMVSCRHCWGERERAPHRRVCCKFSIYIFIYHRVGRLCM